MGTLQINRSQVQDFRSMHQGEQQTVKDVHEIRDISGSIGGADKPCGAIMINRDAGNQKFRAATGKTVRAEMQVIADAKKEGWTRVTLVVSVPDNMVANPVDAEVIEALSQFDDVTVLLVGDDRSVVIATLTK